MSSQFLRNAVVLGLIMAIGPFAIDMYLPALPSISNSLHSDPASAQLTLTAFFITFGAGQLIYGPVSDRLGRKPPLYFGIILFLLASIGCATAHGITILIVMRLLQGLGASACMLIPRAVVRDLHTGADAARLMSLLMLVFSVSPILAPLAGSLLIGLGGWRTVFWVVTALAGIGLLITRFILTETLPPAQRESSHVFASLTVYRRLLRDRHFVGLAFICAFGMASFFIYLANSSFVYIGHFGLTPRQYSLAFSVNAAAFIGVAQLNGWLAAKFGLRAMIRVAVIGYAASMIALVLLTLAGVDQLWVLAAILFLGFGFLGVVIPTTTVLALEEHGAIAGTAAALLGTLQMVSGAVAMAVVSLFANGTPLPMVASIGLAALASLVLSQLTLGSGSSGTRVQEA